MVIVERLIEVGQHLSNKTYFWFYQCFKQKCNDGDSWGLKWGGSTPKQKNLFLVDVLNKMMVIIGRLNERWSTSEQKNWHNVQTLKLKSEVVITWQTKGRHMNWDPWDMKLKRNIPTIKFQSIQRRKKFQSKNSVNTEEKKFQSNIEEKKIKFLSVAIHSFPLFWFVMSGLQMSDDDDD